MHVRVDMVYEYQCVQVHAEARGRYQVQVSSSITLCLIPWGGSLPEPAGRLVESRHEGSLCLYVLQFRSCNLAYGMAFLFSFFPKYLDAVDFNSWSLIFYFVAMNVDNKYFWKELPSYRPGTPIKHAVLMWALPSIWVREIQCRVRQKDRT